MKELIYSITEDDHKSVEFRVFIRPEQTAEEIKEIRNMIALQALETLDNERIIHS